MLKTFTYYAQYYARFQCADLFMHYLQLIGF